MTLVRKVFKRLRSLRDLRRTLKPHPGHFRGLIFSFTRNASRLAALKLRMSLARRKLVVIALAERMGDVVACEPVSRRVRDLHPDAFVLWAVRPSYLDLVKGNPHLDGILQVHCITEWIWLRRLGLFGRVYDLHVNGKYCGMCFYSLSKDDGEIDIDISNYYNRGTLLGSFSRSAGLPMVEGDPVVYIDHQARRTVERLDLPARYIAIHTTSEEDSRNWEEGKWKQLVDQIIEIHKVAVVEIGTRSFLDRPDDEHYVNLCGKCGLLETAEVIRGSLLFIGIDSGPAHLANAVKARGLILLGNYRSFGRYMPYTGFYSDPAQCRLLRSDGVASEIPLELCLSAVAEIGQLSQELPGYASNISNI
jgi:heptosyltransferase III